MTIHITYYYNPHYEVVLRGQQSPTRKPHLKQQKIHRLLLTHAKFSTGKRYKLTLQGPVYQRQAHAKTEHGTGHPNSWRKTLSSLPSKSFSPSVVKVTAMQEHFSLSCQTGHPSHTWIKRTNIYKPADPLWNFLPFSCFLDQAEKLFPPLTLLLAPDFEAFRVILIFNNAEEQSQDILK